MLLLAAAFVLAYRGLPAARPARRDVELAAYAALAWALLMLFAAPLLRSGVGAIATAALVLALVVNAVAVERHGPLAALSALLLVLVPAGLYLYPGWTLGVALLAALPPALAFARRRPSLEARPMGVERGISLRRALLPLALLALAEALVVAPGGGGYLALVKALGHGTARIDAYHWWTPDVSWWHGHYYSPKAPLVAFLALPLSLVLAAVGLQPGTRSRTSSRSPPGRGSTR